MFILTFQNIFHFILFESFYIHGRFISIRIWIAIQTTSKSSFQNEPYYKQFQFIFSVKFGVLVSSFSLSFTFIYVVSFIMTGDCHRRFLFLFLLISGSLVIALYILFMYSPIWISGYIKRPNMYWPAKYKLKGRLTRYIEI